MLLTESTLSLLRGAARDRGGVYSALVPYGISFSDPADVFGDDWTHSPGSATYDDVRSVLKVVAVLAFTKYVPDLRFDRQWWAIQHQCGGHANHQLAMIATRIHLRPTVTEPLLEIVRDGFYAEDGRFSAGQLLASRIAQYSVALNHIKLDCQASWKHLTESVYPIDATQHNLDILSDEPPILRHIVDWKGCLPARYSDEPVIFVLTENSD